jgi:hypothetical protein
MKQLGNIFEDLSKQHDQISKVLSVLTEVTQSGVEIHSTFVTVQKIEERFKCCIILSRWYLDSFFTS